MTERTVSRALAMHACRPALIGLAALGCLLAGCVPVPFRPSATASHTAVAAPEQAPRMLPAAKKSEAESVAKAIQHEEPRVTLVDPAAFSPRIGATGLTLQQVVAAAHEGTGAPAADYVLSVGEPVTRQLHDTGMAVPYILSVVGYEKVQSEEVLPAALLDLRDPQALQVLCASSTYSEVATGLVYGVVTIAMPEPALRESLAREVTHTLTAAQPQGAIRLLVLSQQPAPRDPKSPQLRSAPPAVPFGCDAKRPLGTVTAAAMH